MQRRLSGGTRTAKLLTFVFLKVKLRFVRYLGIHNAQKLNVCAIQSGQEQSLADIVEISNTLAPCTV